MTNISYTWQITPRRATTMVVDGVELTDVYVAIGWSLVGTRGSETFNISGTQFLADPDPVDFTPSQELSSTDLLAWVVKDLGAARVSQLKATIAVEMDAAANAPVVVPVEVVRDAPQEVPA